MKMTMTKIDRDEWVSALLSGRYLQAKGKLHSFKTVEGVVSEHAYC